MGTLYRRFACKDDLVRAILAERAEITLTEMAAGGAADDPWDALAGSITALAAGFAGDQGLFDAVAEAGGRPQLLEVRSRFLDAMAPVLADARAAEVVRDDVTVTGPRHARVDRDPRAPERARGRRPDLGALPRPRPRRAAPGRGVGAAAGAVAGAAVRGAAWPKASPHPDARAERHTLLR